MLPPRETTVSQCAGENRVLTGGAAAERGPWHTRPCQREPMDVLSPLRQCRLVVLWPAAQLLETENPGFRNRASAPPARKAPRGRSRRPPIARNPGRSGRQRRSPSRTTYRMPSKCISLRK